MAIRSIRQEGDEILKKKSKEITDVDDRIRELLDDMVETMHKYDGVGLAAVQVGIIKLIYPVIIKAKGKQRVEEGCLSFPNKFVKVERPNEVVVEGLDEYGEKITIKGKELLAQALLHEIDHLNGVVLTDVMIPGTMEYITSNDNNK